MERTQSKAEKDGLIVRLPCKVGDVVNDKWAFELYCPHCGVRMNLEDDAK